MRDAIHAFMPLGVERDGLLTRYLTAPTFWLMNHGVARSDNDLQALILGAAALCSEPLSFLLPIRQTSLFRWCLAEDLRSLSP